MGFSPHPSRRQREDKPHFENYDQKYSVEYNRSSRNGRKQNQQYSRSRTRSRSQKNQQYENNQNQLNGLRNIQNDERRQTKHPQSNYRYTDGSPKVRESRNYSQTRRERNNNYDSHNSQHSNFRRHETSSRQRYEQKPHQEKDSHSYRNQDSYRHKYSSHNRSQKGHENYQYSNSSRGNSNFHSDNNSFKISDNSKYLDKRQRNYSDSQNRQQSKNSNGYYGQNNKERQKDKARSSNSPYMRKNNYQQRDRRVRRNSSSRNRYNEEQSHKYQNNNHNNNGNRHHQISYNNNSNNYGQKENNHPHHHQHHHNHHHHNPHIHPHNPHRQYYQNGNQHSYNKHNHYHNNTDGYKKQQKNSRSSSSNSGSSSNKSSGVPSQSDSKDRSKDAGHYRHDVGSKMHSKQNTYKIVKHISDGTFGRVLEVINYANNKTYAVKVIRAVERYIDSAQTEKEIIEKIQQQDEQKRKQIVQLYETFYINDKKNYAMVFEKLGPSLYDIIKKNSYRGFPMPIVRDFFYQVLEAIGFLHSIKLTHTDLKPENILLRYTDLQKIYPFKRNRDKKLYVPKDTENQIKIIDFGGATFSDEHHSSIINTRQYRAPEVILQCCKWNEVSDLWSIGCIVMELLTGELFFQTHDNYQHLAMIEKACGEIPEWMRNKAEERDNWFTAGKSGNKFNWPEKCQSKENKQKVDEMDTLDILDDNDLKDLLQKCLAIDPKKRITCKEALQHRFFEKQLEMDI